MLKITFLILIIATQTVATQTTVSKIGNRVGKGLSIGIRVGSPLGITFKQFVAPKIGIEGIAGFAPLGISGLYEIHSDVPNIEGLKLFYGPGGHLNIYTSKRRCTIWECKENPGALGLGVDGIIGAEYKLPNISFTLTLDIKPSIEATTSGKFFFDFGIGLSIRYIL